MMLGVGVGGTFERVAELAKEALVELRQGPHPDPYYDALERELTQRVNALGIGPQGFGGKTTALSVRIKAAPTHIAGLPVAVNVGCHVTRHASASLRGLGGCGHDSFECPSYGGGDPKPARRRPRAAFGGDLHRA